MDFLMASALNHLRGDELLTEKIKHWSDLLNVTTSITPNGAVMTSEKPYIIDDHCRFTRGEGLPELITPYVGENCFIFDNFFILTNACQSKEYFRKYLSKSFEEVIIESEFDPLNAVWDSQRKTIWYGIRNQKDFDTSVELSKKINSDEHRVAVLMLAWSKPLSYYLLTINNLALYCEEAFLEASLYTLNLWYDTCKILVTPEEVTEGVLNSASTGTQVIVSKISDELKDNLSLHGVTVHETPVNSICYPNSGTRNLVLLFE